MKALRSLAGLGGLITVCGLVATVFGFLYGSIFGFEHVLHAAWLQPGEDPLSILTVAIGAGVVLLSIAFLIGIFNAIVSRDWAHLVFGHGGIAAALLYWSLAGHGRRRSSGSLPVPCAVFAGLAARDRADDHVLGGADPTGRTGAAADRGRRWDIRDPGARWSCSRP